MRTVRVAHVITRMIIGGAQENTWHTVQGLREKPEWKVDLITGPSLGPEGALLEQKGANQQNVIVVPFMRRQINVIYDVLAFFHLLRIFHKNRYDIVHTHSSKCGILARFAARAARVSIIVHTVHGMSFHPYQGRILNCLFINLERLAARWTSKIISVCDNMTEKSLKAKIAPAQKFVTVYSGIDVRDFLQIKISPDELRGRLRILHDDIVVGKVARLFDLKGHSFLLKSARRLIGKFSNLKILLVGDGILKENLIDECVKYGIREHVIFAGLVPFCEISSYINIMDVLVHASLREGLARAIPQAMLLGRPVVSFDLDGASEAIINGKSGYLVRPSSVEELTSAVSDLLSDPSGARHMGKIGKELVMTKFDKDNMVQKIEEVYNSQLEEISK